MPGSVTGPLAESFRRGNARELELKCRYLEAAALKETGRLAEALEGFQRILGEAKSIGSARVLSSTYVALIQLHSEMNRATEAFALAREAAPFLQSSNNRVALAKLHWGVGLLMRTQGRPASMASARSRLAPSRSRSVSKS